MGERKTYHRGRRKKKKGGIISTLILIIAIAVFCVSGYQLYKIFGGYHQGKSEYDKVREVAVHGDDKDEDEFVVDFDELKKINGRYSGMDPLLSGAVADQLSAGADNGQRSVSESDIFSE